MPLGMRWLTIGLGLGFRGLPELTRGRARVARDALDAGAEIAQALVDALVAAVDLADVADLAAPSAASAAISIAMPGADVGADSTRSPCSARGPADDRAVRIAQRDARAHEHELVGEEQAVLEHLLEDQDRALGLGRERDGDRGQVGRERRPWAVLDLRRLYSPTSRCDDAGSGRRGTSTSRALDHALRARAAEH